ncbi:hypothetical protein AMK59_1748, partial [Oryctes borbonicus]
QALGVHTIRRRASNDFAVSTVKPATSAESPVSGSGGGFNAAKYQSPPYVAPHKIQYSPPQQLNYVVQPTYKFLPQPTAAAPGIPYVPQQAQQQPQYTPQNVVYNTQPLSKIAPIPQKIYTPIHASVSTPAPYSLAGDVSSFKYTSPIVSYSNLGVIQQSVGRSTAPTQQEAPVRAHYPQPSSQAPVIQQNPVPQPILPTYSQPQQLTYRPKLSLPQIQYNPPSQQHISVPSPVTGLAPSPVTGPKLIYSQTLAQGGSVAGPAPKIVYSQSPQSFATVPRPQPVYPISTQKIAASVPQQILYTIPQQASYTQAQSPQAIQPVQPAHSVPQPYYVFAPQYQINSAAGQHA